MRRMGEDVTQAIRTEISACSADDLIHTTRTRCNGRCEDACVVIVYPEGVWYKNVTAEAGKQIVRQHLVVGKRLDDRMIFNYMKDEGFIATGHGTIGIDKKRWDHKDGLL
ncbi:ferredoxin [Paenibacillus sp. NPDC056579]|uniref:(2Fe-2S) ferredoxin domain-containing protein n=1 Tax=Paenibacillus sp. NPDC056579 TaxID=3345871 RepID=UPI0036CEF101